MTLRDFRRKWSGPLSTGSYFIINEIQQKHYWISEFNKENKEWALGFVGKFSLKNKPSDVAEDILKTLNIDPVAKKENPVKEWVDKSEMAGIFVSRASHIHSKMKLDSEEIQGFAIADPYAPFVFVNSEDWGNAQLFTLVHELAHIWIAATWISNDVQVFPGNEKEYDKIELFCNEVAANALMPDVFMKSLNPTVFSSVERIFSVSKSLGVSSFALLVRGKNKWFISLDQYKKLKHDADEQFRAFEEKEAEKMRLLKAKQKATGKGGGPDYYLLQLNRNSNLFTKIVLDAFNGGTLEPAQASHLLNIKVNKFSKLEELIYNWNTWTSFTA